MQAAAVSCPAVEAQQGAPLPGEQGQRCHHQRQEVLLLLLLLLLPEVMLQQCC
jgi:hypothetical protein